MYAIRSYYEKKILVFVRTKVRAERVHKAMERVGLETVTIHGDKDQKARTHAMKTFKEGKVKVLIATDVSARGIDIPNVQIVVNYDMPDVPENYVHRVGRTGRGMEKGDAISFCDEQEKELKEEIEDFMGKEIAVHRLERGDYANIVGFSAEQSTDWKSVMKEIAQDQTDYKEIKKRSNRKKEKKKLAKRNKK